MIQFIKEKYQAFKSNPKFMELFVYGIFGVLTTLVNWITFAILAYAFPTLSLDIRNAISIVVAVLFAYVTNRKFVFKSTEKNILKEFSSFALSRAFAAVVEMVSVHILAVNIGLSEAIAKIITAVIVIIINYIMSKLIVFRKKEIKE